MPVGSDHPNGAMGGALDDAERVQVPVPEQRRPVGDERQRQPSTYVLEGDDPDRGDNDQPGPTEKKQKKEAPAPKEVDWTAEATRIRTELQNQVAQFQQAAAVPLGQRLQSLPHPSQFTADQLASMTPEESAKYNQGIAERASLENIGGGVLPLIGGLQNQIANTMAANIAQIQRSVYERNPDVAEDVMSMAQGLSAQQQSMPETYDHLVAMAIGRTELAKRGNERISQAGSRIGTAGRGGYSEPIKGRVANNDSRRLATLLGGNKRAMEATIRRLEEQGYTSQD